LLLLASHWWSILCDLWFPPPPQAGSCQPGLICLFLCVPRHKTSWQPKMAGIDKLKWDLAPFHLFYVSFVFRHEHVDDFQHYLTWRYFNVNESTHHTFPGAREHKPKKAHMLFNSGCFSCPWLFLMPSNCSQTSTHLVWVSCCKLQTKWKQKS
jgi:hypothetical protein